MRVLEHSFALRQLRSDLGHHLARDHLLGSVLGIAGISLVYWPEFARQAGGGMALGAVFTLLAVLLSTSGGLLAHRNHERKLHGWPTMAWSMGYGALSALVGRIGAPRASYVGVMAPVVALFVSTLFEGFQWHPLTAVGVAVSIAGNVPVLGGRRAWRALR